MPRRPPAVARVLERVTKTAREHEMFAPGDLVLVSCSGGPDSVCLLYSLWHLRRLFKIRLAVFHFDHKLRPDSAKDAAYVRALAARLKLPFHLRNAEDAPIKGGSVEAWGFIARSRGRSSVASEIGATKIARAQTLDDRAEWLLICLMAGAGPLGLGGPSARHDADVQPLFDVSREEVLAFCRALHLRPRWDPTNDDTSKLRAAIRHRILPLMDEVRRGGARKAIARTADQLRMIEPLIRREMAAARGGRSTRWDGGFRFEVDRVQGAPYEFIDRMTLASEFRVMGHRVTEADVEAVIDLARGRPGRRLDLSGGLKAIREKGYVRVSRSSPES
ncbi:MAG: tRNA lysidine(34) synthetase TilS [Actinobacteria bacterium]|nr:tRNA lysidine(34) synthetase TilS [Actinomycetota bacterium]